MADVPTLPASGPLRLTRNHLAHLRAIAEGVSVAEASTRYLGIDHGAQARLAHARVVELAAQVSRRRLAGWPELRGPAALPSSASGAAPPLDHWAVSEGLEDWPVAELQELYAQRFGAPDRASRRRSGALERLRRQRLAALEELATLAVQPPTAADRLAGWIAPAIAAVLQGRGIYTLGELQGLIARGGRWWAGLPAYGRVKAERLAQHVALLVAKPSRPVFAMPAQLPERLSGRVGANRAPRGASRTDADDDQAALSSWISSRSGSVATSRAYEREAKRFLLWMQLERARSAADATAEDCRAYMDLLADVPETWISRHRASPGAPGWAPFAGPLSVPSQRHAVGILHAWFGWMVAAGYLAGNPWELVQRRVGDAPTAPRGPESRAFTQAGWQALVDQVERESDLSAQARWRWLLVFSVTTGLRPAELVGVTRGALSERGGRWWVGVVGKGARRRSVVLPSLGLAATREYFSARGLDFDSAAAATPLIARLDDAMEAPVYTTLAQSFSRLVRRAARDSALPLPARQVLIDSSLHWLRHTHATRAVERQVPPDVLQANLGHADPRTTAGYYQAQEGRRAEALERVFGSSERVEP